MIKAIGRLKISKRFIKFLDTDTKRMLKKALWSKVTIISTDIVPNTDVMDIIAESEDLFFNIVIGKQTIPLYDIILVSNQNGSLADIKIRLENSKI